MHALGEENPRIDAWAVWKLECRLPIGIVFYPALASLGTNESNDQTIGWLLLGGRLKQIECLVRQCMGEG